MSDLPRPVSVEAHYLAAIVEQLRRLNAAVEQLGQRLQEVEAKAPAAGKKRTKGGG